MNLRQLPYGCLVVLLAACSAPDGGPTVDLPEAHPGGSFRLAQDSPGCLDPARLDDSYEAAIVNQVFDGLLAHDDNLTPVPAIAKSWTISRDGRVYSFHLHENVRFHDGSACTSDDVIYSLSRVFHLDPEKSVLAREYLSPIEGTQEYADGDTNRIRGLEALGPYELRITLTQAHAAFLSVLASEMARIVPRGYIEKVGDDAFGASPIGTGPFRFAEWRPDERIVLLRFDEYYGHGAELDSVVFELPKVGHRDYATEKFLAGHITAMEVQADRHRELSEIEGIQILSRQELSLAYMALNVSKPPFDDPQVRRAMILAMDREAIAGQHGTGRLIPRGILPPGMPGFDPEEKLPPRDVDAARALLAEAGYGARNPLPPIIHASANESLSERALHAELRRQLAEVGIHLQTIYLDWLEFDRRIRRGEFHAFSLIWVADLPDPDSFLAPLFHSAGSNNLYRYSNADVDFLLQQTRGMRSASERYELYRSAERAVLADAPVIPLYHNVATVALQPNVRGFSLNPLGIGSMKLESVWLEDTGSRATVAR